MKGHFKFNIGLVMKIPSGISYLLDYLEGRREGLEPADGEPGAAGDELQELPLLVATVRGLNRDNSKIKQ